MTFGEQCREYRRQACLSQADAAELLGYESKQTVSNWECERAKPWSHERTRILAQLQLAADKAQCRRPSAGAALML